MNTSITKSLIVLLISVAISPLCAASPTDNDGLEDAVTEYWNACSRADKLTAMKYVHPDELNLFLNKKLPVIKKWAIADVSSDDSPNKARVKINYSMETYPGTVFNLSTVENWEYLEEEWKVRVKDSSAAKKALFGMLQGGSGKVKAAGEGLRVRPQSIKFYKSNLKQPAFIWIENNLDSPVELVSLQVDETLIKIAEQPESVSPGERARVKLEYIGGEKEKENLETEILLKIKSGEDLESHSIKAVYNYMNAAMKWIQQRQQSGGEAKP